MKLRIKGNSLRLRLLRSEVQELVRGGRIEETVHFTADGQSTLVYVIECAADASVMTVRFDPPRMVVTLPSSDVNAWSASGQVGIYAKIPLGAQGSLEVAVEKDFACLGRSGAENSDAFPNPHAGQVC